MSRWLVIKTSETWRYSSS